jgi:hypothetical protein
MCRKCENCRGLAWGYAGSRLSLGEFEQDHAHLAPLMLNELATWAACTQVGWPGYYQMGVVRFAKRVAESNGAIPPWNVALFLLMINQVLTVPILILAC